MLVTGFSSRSSPSRFVGLVLGLGLFSIDLQSVCCLRTGSREFIEGPGGMVVSGGQVPKFVCELVKKLLLVVF